MNNYQIRGWIEQVIEVAFVGHEPAGAFTQILMDEANVPLRMFTEVLPPSGGGQPMGAMVEGQIENVVYVRVKCPAHTAHIVFQMIAEAAQRAAPASPGG